MKPSVLLLIDSFNQGGTERQVVQLARLLHEHGRFRVRLACLNPEGPLRAEAEGIGLGEIPSFPLTSFHDRNALVQLTRLARFLRDERVDIVESHDLYTNVLGMPAALLARTPVRIASRRESGGARTAAQAWAVRRAYRLAHAVVANAEAVRRELISDGIDARKTHTVYNGVDFARLAPPQDLRRDDVLARLGLPAEPARRFVTIVANLRHPMKDQQTFLRAARRVREHQPDAAFVLAGEGQLTESLRVYAAELGLGGDAFFIGRCANVAELLAVSDVCVLSSKCGEGFSNSIIEYMAAARPVVATDVGGAAEAVVEGETGYVVPVGDDERMAEGVSSLLADPERARVMGERGREVARRKFSCEAQLERVVGLYEQLLAARRAPADRRVVGESHGSA